MGGSGTILFAPYPFEYLGQARGGHHTLVASTVSKEDSSIETVSPGGPWEG